MSNVGLMSADSEATDLHVKAPLDLRQQTYRQDGLLHEDRSFYGFHSGVSENGELALACLNLVPSSVIDATRTAIALKNHASELCRQKKSFVTL